MIQVRFSGEHWLAPSAAQSMSRCIAEAGTDQTINEAGRTWARQAQLYARYLADKAARRKPPRYAAPPGTSKHETGTAIDIQPGTELWNYMVAQKGEARHWTSPFLHLGERWHFEHDGSFTPSDPIQTPHPQKVETEDMLIITTTSDSTNKVIPKGISFILPASGAVRPMSRKEYEAYKWHAGRGASILFNDWTGDELYAIASTVGLLEWSGLVNDVPQLTGRVIRYGKAS